MEIDCPNFEACGGTLIFRVYRDSDGDSGSPWTVSSWTDAECTGKTCQCDYPPVGWDKLIQEAISASENQEPTLD